MTKPNQEALDKLESAFHAVEEYGNQEALDELHAAIETIRQALQQEGEPVAEIVNRFGDPEAFAERELRVLTDIQALPIGMKLYASPAQVWQPIESAPKDGTWILVAWSHLDIPAVSKFTPTRNVWVARVFSSSQALTMNGNPTHWMPLPPPPSVQGK